MILDGKAVITGSFDFTKAAENENAENLLILKGFPEVVKKYEANYATHRGHAGAYEKPARRK
jgi:phosphatidylserine/phosphatidylglycerophosphate/cardiolipin synthase-like enzyme